MDWIFSLLRFLCPFCQRQLTNHQRACPECSTELSKLEYSQSVLTLAQKLPVVSVGLYEGWLKTLILTNKHDPTGPALHHLASLIGEHTPRHWRGIPLVWVPGPCFGPIHLVDALALRLGANGQTLAPAPALRRRVIGASLAQKKLSREDRLSAENMERRFKALSFGQKGTKIKDVILFDDVVTTGSTIVGLQKMLKQRLGLNVQGVLSIAYTPIKSIADDRIKSGHEVGICGVHSA